MVFISRMKESFSLFFMLIGLWGQLLGQSLPADSSVKTTYPTNIRYYFEADFRNGNVVYQHPDSTLPVSDRVNQAADNSYQYLGVPGSAARSMSFRVPAQLTTYTGIRSNNLYLTENDSIRYYRVNKKFTQIDYHSGTFKELAIQILHSQNITQGWNAGLLFDRFGVKDYILNSDTYKSQFVLFTSYHSKSGLYSMFANAKWQTIEDQMNGGIQNDSAFLFTSTDNISVKGLAYNISDAKQFEHRREFYLSQYIDLGKKDPDTLHSGGKIPLIRINHSLSYNRRSMAYADASADSAFFTNFFYSQITYDSLAADDIDNKLSLIVPADKRNQTAFSKFWSFAASIGYQRVNYVQKQDLSWHNMIAGGEITSRFDSSGLDVHAEAKYVLDGRDKENYEGRLKAEIPLFGLGKIGGEFHSAKYSPDFIYQFNESNNFIWLNRFNKTDVVSLGLHYTFSKYHFRLTVRRTNVKNLAFMNSDALPEQFAPVITVDQLGIEKTFLLGGIHFENNITLQKNSGEEQIHLAPFFSLHSLYYEHKFFTGKMLTDIGVNAAYNSEYFADNFMPVNGLFYRQNEMKTGGYLRVDLFLRIKIKSARIFLKMENINDNMQKSAYYLTPHYPQPGKVFRFGLVWRFFDQ